QVGHDQLLDLAGANAQHLQRAGRSAGDAPAALTGFGFVKAAVDQHGSVGVTDEPDVIVDRMGCIVIVGAYEAFVTPAAGEFTILYGDNLVGFGGHCRPPGGWECAQAMVSMAVKATPVTHAAKGRCNIGERAGSPNCCILALGRPCGPAAQDW